MAALGSFGAAIRELDPEAEHDTFDFFGATFTVVGSIPGMLTLQLGAMISGKTSAVDGLAAVYEALRCSLTVPERDGKEAKAGDDREFNRFYRIAVRHRCDDDELIRLALNIAGYQVGKADEPSPTSPDGGPPTSTNSKSSSSGSLASQLPANEAPTG